MRYRLIGSCVNKTYTADRARVSEDAEVLPHQLSYMYAT